MANNQNSLRLNVNYALQEILGHLKIPENAFVLLALIFGILILFITPPFQVPDEPAHFLRAFQLSELQVIAIKQQNQVGGFIPQSLSVTLTEVSQDIPFKPQNKQKVENIFALLNLPLASDKIFINFPNTSLYSPIPYLPQVFGIKLGTLFGFSPLVVMYMGRITNLLVWIGLVYWSLKITPDFKWLFFLLALTPMSLFQSASLSADAVTNGLSFLWITFIFTQAFNHQKIQNFNLSIIFIISILLSLCKTAYFPLSLLYFLIPKNKFSNRKKYFLTLLLFGLLNIGVVVFWSSLVKNLYIPLQPNVEPKEQLIFIITHPIEFTQIIFNTYWKYGMEYIYHFIGVLGWLDTRLPINQTYSYLTILFLVALGSKPKTLVIQAWQKYLILMLFILNILFIMTLLYLSWTEVGGKIIEGLQGRYFIPVVPLLFVLLHNQKFPFKTDSFKKWIVVYSIFSSTITVTTLLNRYY